MSPTSVAAAAVASSGAAAAAAAAAVATDYSEDSLATYAGLALQAENDATAFAEAGGEASAKSPARRVRSRSRSASISPRRGIPPHQQQQQLSGLSSADADAVELEVEIAGMRERLEDALRVVDEEEEEEDEDEDAAAEAASGGALRMEVILEALKEADAAGYGPGTDDAEFMNSAGDDSGSESGAVSPPRGGDGWGGLGLALTAAEPDFTVTGVDDESPITSQLDDDWVAAATGGDELEDSEGVVSDYRALPRQHVTP